MIREHSGIIPDRALRLSSGEVDGVAPSASSPALRAGWFTNVMPQTLITDVVQYHLDVVVFAGEEKALLLDNLRRTLVPDLRKEIVFVKRVSLRSADDVQAAEAYSGVADYLLFESLDDAGVSCWSSMDPSWLSAYTGTLPYLIGGSIQDADALLQAQGRLSGCVGVTLHL